MAYTFNDSSLTAVTGAFAADDYFGLDGTTNGPRRVLCSRFVLGDQTYANPAWITSLAAAKITGLAASATTDTTNAANISSGTLPAGRLPAFTGDATSTAGTSALTLANSGASAGTYTKVTVDAKGRVTLGSSLTSADLPTYSGSLISSQVTTALGYSPVNKAGDTLSGGLAFSGATGYNPIQILGGVAGYYPAVQDGNGRINWYWNKAGSGGAPTFEVGGEDAVRLKFNTSQAAGAEAGMGVYYAPASTAGASIAWTEILAAFHNRFQYLGNTVLHSANYNAYAPTLTGTGASGTWSISVTGSANNITAYTINQNLGTGNQVTHDSIILTNNGNGTNVRIGDDVWLGDINAANTFRVMGAQDGTKGYIVFGNSDGTALGRSGTGALTYGGNTLYHAGNISSASISSSQVTTGLGYTPENSANKGVANGYASLDSGGKVPSTQLPSYVDDVLEYANTSAFPASGETGKIYVALDTNKTYRWSGSAYVEISASPGSTDAVTEGSTNLYFTNARARAAISASGSLSYNSSTGVVSFTDAVTSVFGRTGAVTLGASDVTTALGYAPYNSTNPSGYITSSALSGYLPLAGGTMTGQIVATAGAGNANSYSGTIRVAPSTTEQWAGVSFPDSVGGSSAANNYWFLGRGAAVADRSFTTHIPAFSDYGSTGTVPSWGVYRTGAVNLFRVWADGVVTVSGNQVLHAGNYTSYSPSLTGSGASGSWGISITGSAATATTANALNTGNNYQVNSIGIGIAASGTAGSIGLNQSGVRSWAVTPTGGNLAVTSGDSSGSITFNGSALQTLAALNAWAGSANITTIGTLASGTVPVARVSGLAASATTDTTNAANISSGTLPSARLTGSYAISVTGSSGSISWGGNVTANTSGTITSGITVNGVYNNGYPTAYGNVINIGGAGHGQLLIGWSGTTGAHADNYIRSLRDSNINTNNWSGWAKIFTDANISTASITSSQVTTALGFTPYNSTNPNGYTSNTGTVTSVSGTGTVSGLTLTGTVTASGSLTLGGTLSLTSANVTTALGFTPYNATNPSGYITSSGSISGNAATATNISNTGTVTLASATEANSIYASAPSYTTDQPVKLLNFDWYGNVFSLGNIRSGATPTNGFGVYYTASGGSRAEIARFGTGGSFNAVGAITQAGNQVLHAGNYTSYNGILRALGGSDGTDFNTLGGNHNSMYYAYIANSANRPSSYGYAYGTILTFSPGQGTAGQAQMYVSHAGNDLCFRGGWNNNSWQTWNRVLTDQNYTGYSPSLTGTGASGTWGISVTGNAATVSDGVYASTTQTISGSKTFSGAAYFTNGYVEMKLGLVDWLNFKSASGTTVGTIMYANSRLVIATGSGATNGMSLGSGSGTVFIDAAGAITGPSSITATQFNGSGAGLSSSTVPIAAHVAGDYSAKVTSGTYSINISGTAQSATTFQGIGLDRFLYGSNYRRSSTYANMDTSDTSSGFYFYNTPSGGPFGDWTHWINCIGADWNPNYGFQIAHAFHSDSFAVRRVTNGSWSSWRTILTNANWSSFITASLLGLGTGNNVTFNAVNDVYGSLRALPQNSQGGVYTLVAADTGRHISASSTITVPSGVFSAGQLVTVYNNTAGNIAVNVSGVTMYQAGTANSGNRTLAQRGIATILCVAANTFVISGTGLT